MKLNRMALFSVAFALMMLAVPLTSACHGKVTGGGQCVTASTNTIPSASFGFNAMVVGPDAPSLDGDVKGELNYVDHTTLDHFHMHIVYTLAVTIDEPGNKPWPMMRADFEGPCLLNGVEDDYWAKVTVFDLGEPGKDDNFYIEVYHHGVLMYTGGSLTVPILAGNIQIHKPMWVPEA